VSAWRFWLSRISGAAYAAWVENSRFSRMNGYGSHRWTTAMMLAAIHAITMRVCTTMNRQEPNTG
jgi:hypothetical protein